MAAGALDCGDWVVSFDSVLTILRLSIEAGSLGSALDSVFANEPRDEAAVEVFADESITRTVGVDDDAV